VKPEAYVVVSAYHLAVPTRCIDLLNEVMVVEQTYSSETKRYEFKLRDERISLTLVSKEEMVALIAAQRLEKP